MKSKSFTQKLFINYLLIIFISMAFAACTNTQKLINQGNYDAAINHSIKKLRKNKKKEKVILFLDEAFKKSLTRDLNRISFLKKEDNPDNSVEIYRLYEGIKERQEMIAPLLPLYAEGEEIIFEFINVDSEIIAWKREAAGYLYAHAMSLLEKNDKLSARQAYDELLDTKNIYPNYQDVDQQLEKALNMGMNWVKFSVINNSPNLIPKDFAEELYKTNVAGVEGKWFRFTGFTDQSDDYDYVFRINLKFVDVGPEQVKEREYDQTKEIVDHYEFQKDEQNHYVLDSLGNKIKIPVNKVISCHVIETRQTKAAILKGNFEYLRTWDNQIIRTEPFNVNALFENSSAKAFGDKNALDKKTKALLRNNPAPFPTDYEMIMDGGQRLKPVIQKTIERNRNLLEQ